MSYMRSKLRQLSADEFLQFVDQFNVKSLYQTPCYGSVMEKQHMETMYLGLGDENGTIVAASLILVERLNGFKYAYAPRGFLINYNNFSLLRLFTKEIKKYLGRHEIMAIKISPYIIRRVINSKKEIIEENQYFDTIYLNFKKLGYYHLGFNHYFEAFKPRYEAMINLNRPYYELFMNMSKQYRTKVRSAERHGVSVHKDSGNNLEYLYLQTKNHYPRDLRYYQDIYRYFHEKDQVEFYYTRLDTKYYLEMIQNLYVRTEDLVNRMNFEVMKSANKNNEKLIEQKLRIDSLLAKYKNDLVKATAYLRDYPNGAITSSALVIKQQKEVTLLMDGYDPQFKSFNSKHLLLWKLIEKYSKEGFERFHLGGMSNPLLEQNPYSGLNQFKFNFGAYAYEYIGDLELITNGALYFMYQNTSPIRGMLKK